MSVRRWLERTVPAGWAPYLLHARPRAWFIVAAHMSVGLVLAVGVGAPTHMLWRWALAVVAWSILGNGGTLALNSAYDCDEGDIGYLEDPPPVPRYLATFALALLGLGLPIAAMVGLRFLIAYLVCLALSLLYSVPPIRLKARAGWDVIINSVGYGGLTIYAGWAASGRDLTPPIVNVVIAFGCFFVGFYPLTQIYQMEEDSRRQDYTLALALGKQRALLVAFIGVIAGFAFLLVEAAKRYWLWRSAGLGVALLAWGAVLAPWYLKWRSADVRYEQRGFYLALYAWALTDIAAAIAFMP